MKIKRYFAPDIRQAMRMVRETQGPDAVILSNRRVKGGIEIVAAVDYEEQELKQYDRSESEEVTLSGARFAAEVPRPQPVAAEKPATRPAPSRPATVEWSQEPTLLEMRQELRDLRALMEAQLSGLAWGDLGKRHPLHARLIRRLMEIGFSVELAREVVAAIPDHDPFEEAWRKVLGALANKVQTAHDDILTGGSVVALIGPTGVGKTTTIAKLAARFALRHGKKRVALLTTDNFRVGAHEQLRTYGRIIDVPVHVVTDQDDLLGVLAALADKDLVLIDTAGMSQRDLRLSEQLSMLQRGTSLVKKYLVLSAATQMLGLDEAVRAFQGSGLDGCIITKLDEATSLGGVLSVVIRNRLPIAYVSDGQRVPEDIHPARVHNLISKSVNMRQQHGSVVTEEGVEMDFGRVAANAHL